MNKTSGFSRFLKAGDKKKRNEEFSAAKEIYTGENYTVRYKGKIKSRTLLELVPFIRELGERALYLTGLPCILLAITSLFYFDEVFFIFGSSLPGHLLAVLLFILLVFTFTVCGYELLYSVDYVKATRCLECGKEFAYEERKRPDIKEISTPHFFSVTVIRYWRCRYCGCEDSSESQENIEARKGKRNKNPFKALCEYCKQSSLHTEFKDPDIKEIKTTSSSSEAIITRYYCCEHCGHRSIRVEKEERINTGGAVPGRIREIEDPRIFHE